MKSRLLTLLFIWMLVLPVQATEETFACFEDSDDDHVPVPLLVTDDSFYFSPTWKEAQKMEPFKYEIYNKDEQGNLWGEENWRGNATFRKLAVFSTINQILILDGAPFPPVLHPPPRSYSCVEI